MVVNGAGSRVRRRDSRRSSRSRSPGPAGRSNSLPPAPSGTRRRSTRRDVSRAGRNNAPSGSTATWRPTPWRRFIASCGTFVPTVTAFADEPELDAPTWMSRYMERAGDVIRSSSGPRMRPASPCSPAPTPLLTAVSSVRSTCSPRLGCRPKPHSAPPRRISRPGRRNAAQLMLDSPAATAKPRTVTKPATLPAWRAASGIIESISMTSRAPAAKPLMAAWSSPEAPSAMP